MLEVDVEKRYYKLVRAILYQIGCDVYNKFSGNSECLLNRCHYNCSIDKISRSMAINRRQSIQ